MIKLNSDIFSNLIYKHFNYCIHEGEFPNDSKHTDVVPVLYMRKTTNAKKKNYRPVKGESHIDFRAHCVIMTQRT